MFCECDMIILDMNNFEIIFNYRVESDCILCKY